MDSKNMMFNETLSDREQVAKKVMLGVYGWMTLALAVTAASALYVVSNINLLYTVVRYYLFFGIAEVGVVIYLSARATKMSKGAAKIWFLVYSVLNGVTLASIFAAYDIGVIGYAFLVTAVVFAVMTLYGYVTKTDLSAIGNLFSMALIGLLIATLFGFFFRSPGYTMALMYIGVVIFIGLIGYDTQRIKQLAYYSADQGQAAIQNAGIIGALILYLDFINIFIRLVTIMGRRD